VDPFRDALTFPPLPPRASHALPPLPGSFTYPSVELVFVVLGSVVVSVLMVGRFSSADFLPSIVRIIPHHLDGGGDVSCVDIGPHPSMEGRGQMVVPATENIVVERMRGGSWWRRREWLANEGRGGGNEGG
jgi:hypothetical protein